MAKKVTVEVDAETSKAKRKLQELEQTGGPAAGADIASAAAEAAAATENLVEKQNQLNAALAAQKPGADIANAATGHAAGDTTAGMESLSSASRRAAQSIDKMAHSASSAADANRASRQDQSTDAVSPAADRASRSLDKVSRSASSVAEEAGKSSASMTRLVKSFAGIGAGMAAGYAANYMDPGAGRTALGYASAVLSGAGTGAAMGSMIPGIGTTAGAIVGVAVGAGKQYLDNSKREDDWFKDFKAGEKTFQENRSWADKFEELTSVKTHFKGLSGVDELKAQLAEVDAAAKRTADAMKILQQDEKTRLGLIESIGKRKDFTADEKIAMASEESAGLAFTRQQLAQVEAASKRLANMRENLEDAIEEKGPSREARTSMDALDSLAQVGGNFAGSDQGFRDLQRVNERQVAILEKIEAKTGKGAGKF